MSTSITLAGAEDLDRVLSLMERYHDEAGLPFDEAHRQAVAGPLVTGSPLGGIWLIGPRRAPLGYVMIGFSWSMAHGGLTGWLEEIFLRASVRGRGIGTEVLHAVVVTLAKADLRAMHVLLPPGQEALGRFCRRTGFTVTSDATLLTDRL